MSEEKKRVFGRITIDPARMQSVIYDQRTRLGLSHRALAEKAGVAPTTVYNLEQGSYRVQLDKFLSVLGALDLLPEHVFEIDGKAEELPPSKTETKIREIMENRSLDEALIQLGELLRKFKK